MRFFKNAFAAAAVVAAMGVVGVFAQSEDAVATGIEKVGITAATLQISVAELSAKNFASKGSEIVAGLKNLTVSTTTLTTAITFNKPVPFDNSAAEEIIEVLTGFVNVHQNLLTSIISVHSLVAKASLTAPVGVALGVIQTATDAFEVALDILIPTQKANAQKQFASLNVTFTAAIKAYS